MSKRFTGNRPINSFRRKQSKTVCAVYAVELAFNDPVCRPDHKIVTVGPHELMQSLNVIRQLIDNPPEGTRLIAFSIFPEGFSPSQITGYAAALGKSQIAHPFFHEKYSQPTSETDKKITELGEIDQQNADLGGEHYPPSRMAPDDPQGGGADPQP